MRSYGMDEAEDPQDRGYSLKSEKKSPRTMTGELLYNEWVKASGDEADPWDVLDESYHEAWNGLAQFVIQFTGWREQP